MIEIQIKEGAAHCANPIFQINLTKEKKGNNMKKLRQSLIAGTFFDACPETTKKPSKISSFRGFLAVNNEWLLDYQDSNLDKQNQNLLCYHYTIRQCLPWMAPWGAHFSAVQS